MLCGGAPRALDRPSRRQKNGSGGRHTRVNRCWVVQDLGGVVAEVQRCDAVVFASQVPPETEHAAYG